MDKVTAKMKVSRVTPCGDPEQPWAHEVELTPDYAQGKNEEWAAATPSAVFRMTVKNELAVEQLRVGRAATVVLELED